MAYEISPRHMRLFRILTFKELKGYFLNPFGWVVLAFVTVMQGVSLHRHEGVP